MPKATAATGRTVSVAAIPPDWTSGCLDIVQQPILEPRVDLLFLPGSGLEVSLLSASREDE